jgi:hypothetical protein
MKNISLLIVALTTWCYTSLALPIKYTSCEFISENTLSTNDSTIEMHWKTNECEIFLFNNGTYKINYFDGTFSQGIWTNSEGKITFFKDYIYSTSDKDFQFTLMTKKEFDKLFEGQYGQKEIDPYPLLLDNGK